MELFKKMYGSEHYMFKKILVGTLFLFHMCALQAEPEGRLFLNTSDMQLRYAEYRETSRESFIKIVIKNSGVENDAQVNNLVSILMNAKSEENIKWAKSIFEGDLSLNTETIVAARVIALNEGEKTADFLEDTLRQKAGDDGKSAPTSLSRADYRVKMFAYNIDNSLEHDLPLQGKPNESVFPDEFAIGFLEPLSAEVLKKLTDQLTIKISIYQKMFANPNYIMTDEEKSLLGNYRVVFAQLLIHLHQTGNVDLLTSIWDLKIVDSKNTMQGENYPMRIEIIQFFYSYDEGFIYGRTGKPEFLQFIMDRYISEAVYGQDKKFGNMHVLGSIDLMKHLRFETYIQGFVRKALKDNPGRLYKYRAKVIPILGNNLNLDKITYKQQNMDYLERYLKNEKEVLSVLENTLATFRNNNNK